jgi:hypothetical protein
MNSIWLEKCCGKKRDCCASSWVRKNEGCAVQLAQEREEIAQKRAQENKSHHLTTIPKVPNSLVSIGDLFAGAIFAHITTGLVKISAAMPNDRPYHQPSPRITTNTASYTPTSVYSTSESRHLPDADPYHESGSTDNDSGSISD